MKLYVPVNLTKKEYEIYRDWKSCESYLEQQGNDKKTVATFYEDEEGFDKLISFVNYCFKGTTYEGRRIADDSDAVYLLVSQTLKNQQPYISFLIYHDNEIVDAVINLEVPKNTQLTAEQYGIIYGLLQVESYFSHGTEVLIGVNSDYLVNMFLTFYSPKSKSSNLFNDEFNKYTSNYIVELVKATNYPQLKQLMKNLKLRSKQMKV